MSASIALQLYTVRDALKQDFAGTVRRVAEIGFPAVESFGFAGATPQAAAQLFTELGLTVCSAHLPLPVGIQKNEVLDTAAALGVERVVCAYLNPEDYFSSRDQVYKACDLINEGYAVATEHGLSLGYHNHWWEFEPVEGFIPFDLMVERLDPNIFFELDIYWTQVGGADPVKILKQLGPRAPLLHIKDGPGIKGQPHLALGEGVIDIPAVLQAAGQNPEWLIVELDECATSMLEAVEKSYQYLTQSIEVGSKE